MVIEPLVRSPGSQLDLSGVTVICADLLENHWIRVDTRPMATARNQVENVLLIDLSNSQYELLPTFILDMYVGEAPPDYPYIRIPANPASVIELAGYQQQILRRFHYSWLNELRDVLYTDWFKAILGQVKEARSVEAVYPASADLFTAFLAPFTDIRALWLGMSPYTNYQDSTGMAFVTYQRTKTPSLAVLERGIRQALNRDASWVLPNDLLPLRRDGVLLLNAALSTTTDASSHLALWKPFITVVLQKLVARYPQLPVVLFGKAAGAFAALFDQPISVPHPSYYARFNSEPAYGCLASFFTNLQIHEFSVCHDRRVQDDVYPLF